MHAMPKFGFFRLNGDKKTQKSLKIDDPPNDRKRKDKVIDLTNALCNELRPLRGQADKYSLEVMHRTKHPGDEKLYYVGALMISKSFPVTEIISFVDKLTPRIWFQTTY